MSTSAIAIFLEVYDPETGANKARWQNFFIDRTVSGHVFRSFQSSDILMNRSASEGGVSLEMAATQDNLSLFALGMDSEWMAKVTLYEMPVTTAMPTNIDNAVVIARFLGEILDLSTNLTSLSVEIGTALSAINGNIPGRKITTSLVGRLPTL